MEKDVNFQIWEEVDFSFFFIIYQKFNLVRYIFNESFFLQLRVCK